MQEGCDSFIFLRLHLSLTKPDSLLYLKLIYVRNAVKPPKYFILQLKVTHAAVPTAHAHSHEATFIIQSTNNKNRLQALQNMMCRRTLYFHTVFIYDSVN